MMDETMHWNIAMRHVNWKSEQKKKITKQNEQIQMRLNEKLFEITVIIFIVVFVHKLHRCFANRES